MLYRYTLEKYNGPGSRYTCPGCGKAKTFTRYINNQTSEHLSPSVGRCSREMNCGFHYNPKQYFQEHGIEQTKSESRFVFKQPMPPQPKPVSFVADDIFKCSLKDYEQNNFVQYLKNLFGAAITRQLIAQYFIGTSNHWTGATVFWQIDANGKIRTGKIMLYSPYTGKRVKQPFNYITWVHKALQLPEFELQQCLFGEHLLRSDPQKPVAIVESEKTAIIASVYLPGFIWVAVGSLNNLNAEKCKPLAGRKVILYPDLKAFEKWKGKAAELSIFARFTVSDLLESKSNKADKQQGFDLADYLIKFPLPTQAQVQPKQQKEILIEQFKAAIFKDVTQIGNWNIEKWFDVFEKLGLKATDALTAVYQLSWEHGFEIEAEQPITNDLQPESEFLEPIKKEATPGTWEQEIVELDQYFASIEMPSFPIRLNSWTYVVNVSEMIKTHFTTVRANNGNKTFLPFLNRLQELKKYCSLIN